MKAGFSNLAVLKSWLLPAGLLTGTDYDAQILAIGLGVAGQLEDRCNRKFGRTVGDTFETSADRAHVVLPRFPVEALTAVEQRDSKDEAWQDIAADVEQQDLAKGYVEFLVDQGPWYSRLRFTYTGGYFFETAEPTDVGYPTATPAGSTALPADLQLAWRLQCEHVWAQRDKLGLQVGEKPTATPALSQIELLPAVVELLRPYIRYSLT